MFEERLKANPPWLAAPAPGSAWVPERLKALGRPALWCKGRVGLHWEKRHGNRLHRNVQDQQVVPWRLRQRLAVPGERLAGPISSVERPGGDGVVDNLGKESLHLCRSRRCADTCCRDALPRSADIVLHGASGIWRQRALCHDGGPGARVRRQRRGAADAAIAPRRPCPAGAQAGAPARASLKNYTCGFGSCSTMMFQPAPVAAPRVSRGMYWRRVSGNDEGRHTACQPYSRLPHPRLTMLSAPTDAMSQTIQPRCKVAVKTS